MLFKKIGIFTNSVYDIFGFMTSSRLYGIVVNSKYLNIYKKWQFVNLPKYHLPNDLKPQFYKKEKK